MAVKMRLRRMGQKKAPFYRVVVADARAPRDGSFIEKVGYYNPLLPRESKERLVVKEDSVKAWLAKGAQPTDRVARMLGDLGILPKATIPAQTKKSLPKAKAVERAKAKEEARLAKIEAEKAAAEAAAAEEAAKAEAENTVAEAPAAE